MNRKSSYESFEEFFRFVNSEGLLRVYYEVKNKCNYLHQTDFMLILRKYNFRSNKSNAKSLTN